MAAGDEITYKLTWSNDGKAAGVVDSTDDLTDVLDDAKITAGPTPSDASVTVGLSDDKLRVKGPIAAGGDSDRHLHRHGPPRWRPRRQHDRQCRSHRTFPRSPVDENVCTPVDPPKTVHRIGELTYAKSVDPDDGSAVVAGDVVTYTLTFDNTKGTGAADVDSVDDLTGVVDDATLDVDSLDDSLTPVLDDDQNPTSLSIKGSVPAGEKKTFTYKVTVNEFAEQGDHVLKNALLCPDDAGAGCEDATTSNPVRACHDHEVGRRAQRVWTRATR